MLTKTTFHIEDLQSVKENLLDMAHDHELSCILDSNANYPDFTGMDKFHRYDMIAGFARANRTEIITDLEDLEKPGNNQKDWFLGYITYDIKNKIEKLESVHRDSLRWPPLFFFRPEILLLVKNGTAELITYTSSESIKHIQKRLNLQQKPKVGNLLVNLHPRFSKEEYISRVKQIQQLIHAGNIYEMNFCQEFYARGHFNPYRGYLELSNNIPSPFSVFLKINQRYLLSASPERFLYKEGDVLLSQPIKGTINRGTDSIKDERLKQILKNDPKERSENVMIVDLVRNDLSRIAKTASVEVTELCEIYSFPRVHQMISTIKAKATTNSLTDILKATFPMGSMTGAPKIEAMRIIDRFEIVKRGLYSGTVGYIDPNGNFDLNVVIRSLQYHAPDQYLSYMAGSAITALSDPEKEYEECLLKVYGMNSSIQNADYA